MVHMGRADGDKAGGITFRRGASFGGMHNRLLRWHCKQKHQQYAIHDHPNFVQSSSFNQSINQSRSVDVGNMIENVSWERVQ
mmetsp:Transcript_19913/g.56359  ORF Transcript_19913/g.56359 Transcript_19913/m.56359 type:complete len:82 (+) Transcript_19913:177-422(+)